MAKNYLDPETKQIKEKSGTIFINDLSSPQIKEVIAIIFDDLSPEEKILSQNPSYIGAPNISFGAAKSLGLPVKMATIANNELRRKVLKFVTLLKKGSSEDIDMAKKKYLEGERGIQLYKMKRRIAMYDLLLNAKNEIDKRIIEYYFLFGYSKRTILAKLGIDFTKEDLTFSLLDQRLEKMIKSLDSYGKDQLSISALKRKENELSQQIYPNGKLELASLEEASLVESTENTPIIINPEQEVLPSAEIMPEVTLDEGSTEEVDPEEVTIELTPRVKRQRKTRTNSKKLEIDYASAFISIEDYLSRLGKTVFQLKFLQEDEKKLSEKQIMQQLGIDTYTYYHKILPEINDKIEAHKTGVSIDIAEDSNIAAQMNKKVFEGIKDALTQRECEAFKMLYFLGDNEILKKKDIISRLGISSPTFYKTIMPSIEKKRLDFLNSVGLQKGKDDLVITASVEKIGMTESNPQLELPILDESDKDAIKPEPEVIRIINLNVRDFMQSLLDNDISHFYKLYRDIPDNELCKAINFAHRYLFSQNFDKTESIFSELGLEQEEVSVINLLDTAEIFDSKSILATIAKLDQLGANVDDSMKAETYQLVNKKGASTHLYIKPTDITLEEYSSLINFVYNTTGERKIAKTEEMLQEFGVPVQAEISSLTIDCDTQESSSDKHEGQIVLTKLLSSPLSK